MMDQVYNWVKKAWCNILAIWLDKYMSKLGSDLWLDIRNLQLYKAVGLNYVREIFGIKYEIKKYDNKTKCKTKNKSCGRIKRHLIIGLKEYNI